MGERSNYAKRKTMSEQYMLVMECRTSGLTDYQWCMENGIKPGTFHSWVERLKKHPEYMVPPHKPRDVYRPEPLPDVVKLEFGNDPDIAESDDTIRRDVIPSLPGYIPNPIEISMGDVRINISNGADINLVSAIVRTLGGGVAV